MRVAFRFIECFGFWSNAQCDTIGSVEGKLLYQMIFLYRWKTFYAGLKAMELDLEMGAIS